MVASTRALRYSLIMIDVRNWLVEGGFENLVDLFEQNEIDGEVLFDLTDDDLREIGLALGSRKKLLKAIAGGNAVESSQVSASAETSSVRVSDTPVHVLQGAERRQLLSDVSAFGTF